MKGDKTSSQIPLRDASIAAADRKNYCIKITDRRGKQTFFAAPNAQLQQEWMVALQKASKFNPNEKQAAPAIVERKVDVEYDPESGQFAVSFESSFFMCFCFSKMVF